MTWSILSSSWSLLQRSSPMLFEMARSFERKSVQGVGVGWRSSSAPWLVEGGDRVSHLRRQVPRVPDGPLESGGTAVPRPAPFRGWTRSPLQQIGPPF